MHRQYLSDSAIGVLLKRVSSILEQIAAALENPVWGIWLGRKTCIPSEPVMAGLKIDKEEALRLLIGDTPIEHFTRQIDVEHFGEGRDSLPDSPVSFATESRKFKPRRVKVFPGKSEL